MIRKIFVCAKLSSITELCALEHHLLLSDIYVSVVSYTHQIAAKGFFLAIVSTTVETANPEAELQFGLDLLGPIEQK